MSQHWPTNPIRSTDQASARVLMIAAGASVVIHVGIAATVLSAKLTAPAGSDYWAAAPAWTTEIAFNNEAQLKASQQLSPANTPTPEQKLDEPKLQPRELAANEIEQPPKEIEVRPGIDESLSDSRDWIGSAIPTPHAAPKSGVNQAGQSMNPGNPGAPGSENPDTEDTQHTATASPTQQIASQQASNASKSAPPREQSQQQQQEQQKASKQSTEQFEKSNPAQPKLTAPIELDELGLPKHAEQNERKPEEQQKQKSDKQHNKSQNQQEVLPKPSILGALSRPNEVVPEDAQEVSQPTQQPNQQQTPQTTTNNTATTPASKSTAAGTGGNQKLPGELTDAESAPSSLDDMLEYKPGRPLAGKGIRVRPVAARFSHTTQLTALPKNPRLIIKFNRAGRVVSVEFENKEGTGYPDVDAPLRDSIFRWTASGKALQELPTHDPQATVTMKIEYLLREE